MKKILKMLMVALVTVLCFVETSVVTARPVAAAGSCEHSILGLRPWYAGLDMGEKCTINTPTEEQLPGFVWKIVLNVLTDLFLIAGYVSVGFVIYGGYRYLMSGGDPGKVAQGKKTLTNAIAGLIISLLATLITNLIITILNGATS